VDKLPVGKIAVQVDCGGRHTAVLYNDNSVKLIGYNGFGQCNEENIPKESNKLAVQVSCGFQSTSVLFLDGSLRIFGAINSGSNSVNNINYLQHWIF